MKEPPAEHRRLVPGPEPADPEAASRGFLELMRTRRTVRHFSDRPVDQRVVEHLIAAAGTAPSGANKQPWRFVAIQDPALKRQIREEAEHEEQLFYQERANAQWLNDLDPLGTNQFKPFLEEAPWLIVVFKLMRDDQPGRDSDQVYYVNESVGIAVGLLLAAARTAGLATLTHTPSPMRFLGPLLGRAEYERPYVLIPLGYPTTDCVVPDIERKTLDQIMILDREVPLRAESDGTPLPDLSGPRGPKRSESA